MDGFAQQLENLAHGVLDAPWARFLYGFRWVFIFLDLTIVVAFILVYLKARELRPHFLRAVERTPSRSLLDTRVFGERWEGIMRRALKAPPQSLVLAIIEADKCVDDALKALRLSGEHMADRLEQLSADDYPSLDRLWRAHRVRNELVHTPDFSIDPRDAEEVLKIYEKFLKELGALAQ